MKQKRAILLEAVSTGKQAAALRQSLPEQDARLNEVAAANNWNIVDVILVPGHSRVYYTYREFAEDALAEGIAAPMRMFDHWSKRDFDIFAVSTGDRFGREQSIFAEVVARTIDIDAEVFTLKDGFIHKGNYRMFVSMAGYSAAGEIDELVRRRKFGMSKRAKRGLPLTSHGHIPSHKTIGNRDEMRTVVNEDARRLFADIADLLLARISWRQMPKLLAERGHFRSNGRPLSATTLRLWLMHPTFHGNTAEHFQDGKNFPVGRGFWVFDPSEPAPDYVTIHYGTHPPMYEGMLAERVKAELRRRFNEERAKPMPRRKFTGLVVCNLCHYAANYKQIGNWLGLQCTSRHHADLEGGCPNYRYVNEKKLIEAARGLLNELSASEDWSVLFGQTERDDSAERLAAVERELITVKEQAKRLYDERAAVPNIFIEQFNQSIDNLKVRGEALEIEQARLRLHARAIAPDAGQVQALDDYCRLDPDALWLMENGEINQWLARIMGKRRFVIDDGRVLGTTGQPRRNKHLKRETVA